MPEPVEGVERPLEERPGRIARRRALEAEARPEVGPEREEPVAEGEEARTLATVLGRALGDRRRLDEALEDLSTRVAALAGARRAGPGAFLGALLAAASAAGLLYAGLGTRLASLEGDLATVLDRSDRLADEVHLAQLEGSREREAARKRAAEDLRRVEEAARSEREDLEAARALLERRLGELDLRLARSEGENALLGSRLEAARRELAAAKLALTAARTAESAEVEEPPPRVDEPSEGAPPPAAEEPLADRLNLLLARVDGAKIYRVLSAAGVSDGALRTVVLEIYSAEGEVLEEVRADRLEVELSEGVRRVALSFRDCERRFRKGDREDVTRLPWFQVEFFVEAEPWGSELAPIARWTR